MQENLIREIVGQALDGVKMPQGALEELIASIVSSIPHTDASRGSFGANNPIPDLQKQISEETDWKKKAALAAKIISLSLE